ncbi:MULTISPECIES: cytochrome c oxidase accessory protein CcoG [unclassified Pseudomonas]|uniref:cytochrome c oxidase accessory protein CcoG n=1 Tax=unclassified Pseudomonas TaxID=196821 RepID=UPI000BDB6DC1|nr:MULTISPECIES: cytochrome c oxidase accessory protein CcoG [unclassified Pseudomonas]PVZ13891.1 cytochrome c oxidase accessory protein FixG [Pseudomonas sp. URIL14HWK12:I12]PVZ24197.1 cytochrome c oxidase accessory protein FixG [Pseudomonas sp. URIL14HWK12:I10]PVZ33164.1 cytochrome c oxidase accessory protein FixG [Pseudomonas sp. URIL14HWK12:I11]SNZ10574.1 cytochrome c oxidase accessory protein FixG [Pseudomonas sp. URIL14HWK12:I9]
MIRPRVIDGRYRRLRFVSGGLLLALFFGAPWLQWGGRQALWWDLPGRQLHLGASTFWPQDLSLLAGVLAAAAFGLFVATVYAGRIWCGYACPQSLWLWMFHFCQRATEGRRGRPTLPRRLAKHSLWLLLALVTGFTLVGYFSPIRQLPQHLGLNAASLWLGLVTLATWLNAGWLREQVCVHLCPYGRFQSVMLDRDSLIVAYDATRGEPRAHLGQGGDCVDCTLCVQVCPTGIDIRDGLQAACLSCGACADACDSVMRKLARPEGLVRYASEHALAGARTHWLRPRLLGYVAVLMLISAGLGWALAQRPLLALDVSKDRLLYRQSADGRLENVYRLTLANKTDRPRHYRLTASGPVGLELQGATQVEVPAQSQASQPVRLVLGQQALAGGSAVVQFIATDTEDSTRSAYAESRFTGPQP